MARSGNSRANENRRIRQDALRDQLETQGHIQHVIDLTDKLSDLSDDLDSIEVSRIKAAADIKLKIIDKYLPALKQSDITIDGDITAKDASRAELEAKLLANGINPEELS